MLINSASFHYKYFLFLKRLESAIKVVMDYPQSDPYSHYVFFNKIGWCNKLCNKLKISESLFQVFNNLGELIKLVFNRIILYQLWGSLIVLIILNVLKFYNLLIVTTPIDYILTGALPIFYIILLIGIFHCIYEFLKAVFNSFLGRVQYHRRVNIKYNNVISYFLYILFSPFLFVSFMFLEISARILVTFIYYQFIGIKFFVEIIWLLISLVIILLTNIFSLISRLGSRVKFSSNENSLKKFISFNLKK